MELVDLVQQLAIQANQGQCTAEVEHYIAKVEHYIAEEGHCIVEEERCIAKEVQRIDLGLVEQFEQDNWLEPIAVSR